MATLTPEDFKRLVAINVPETVTALAFSPDGSLLAVAAGDKVHLFSIPPQARVKEETPPGSSAPGI